MCRTRLWCVALVNGFRTVHWQDLETQGWLFFSGRFGSALVWVLTNSLSSYTYSLKLEACLFASVVALPPQLCSLHFCICSGLESTCCPHVLCFVFSHRLLVLTTACTYLGLLAKASVLQGENSCLVLSLTVFTLKANESALEFKAGKNENTWVFHLTMATNRMTKEISNVVSWFVTKT